MHDDYLWDRSGEPDSDTVRLERALAAFRHRGGPPSAAAVERATRTFPSNAGSRRYPVAAGLIAASLIAAIAILLAGVRHRGDAWQVAVLGGQPTVDRVAVDQRGMLSVGQWLVTDASSRAIIDVGDIGSVEVSPNSRVRLVSARPTDSRIELQRGLVRAMIFAPPRRFAVESPSGIAVDLGCVYTLQVEEDGAGLLHVESGWVAFAESGRESFVPAGASAETRPHFGPGTPYFDDASPRLRMGLSRLDFESASAAERAAALDSVLETARRRDGITLWHLLLRVRPDERGRVFDRLASLVPPGDGVTREGVLRGDREMLEAWWDELGLQPLSWWREWERPWTPSRKQ
jgi:hypothetical protein